MVQNKEVVFLFWNHEAPDPKLRSGNRCPPAQHVCTQNREPSRSSVTLLMRWASGMPLCFAGGVQAYDNKAFDGDLKSKDPNSTYL